MIKKFLRCVALLSLFCTTVNADSVVWEASSGLLPHEVSSSFLPFDSANPEDLIVSDGVLTISTYPYSEEMGYFIFPTFDGSLVIETEMRVVSGAWTQNNRAPAAIGFAWDTAQTPNLECNGVFFYPDRITLGSGQTANVDTTQSFHTYEIRVDESSGNTELYYDGALTLSGVTAPCGPGNKAIDFGDNSDNAYGTTEWKSFSYGPHGEAEPQPGEILALHKGSADPQTEGWNKIRPFSGVDTYPVVNDRGAGIDAWAVDDNVHHGPSEGLYVFDLTKDQVDVAMKQGWKLSASIRVADSPTVAAGGSVGFAFASDAIHLGMAVGSDTDGTPIIDAQGTLTLEGLDDGYHLYELVYSPLNNSAQLFVDGALTKSDISAGGVGNDKRKVMFGTWSSDHVGQGNYSLVKFEILPLLGDFDEDGLLTAADIDLLTEAVLNNSNDLTFDLNHNGSVGKSDRLAWVNDLKNTYFGDSNLDGEFNTGDLVEVLQTGKYETQEPAGWSEGDWEGNGFFDTGDLVFVLALGGYEEGPKNGVSTVPEPTGCYFMWIAVAGLLLRIRTRGR